MAAEVTSGQYRLALRDIAGNVLDFSAAVDFDVLNNSVPPRWVFNFPGTVTDQPTSWATMVHGTKQEVLELQILDSSAHTFATATFTVRFTVREFWIDGKGQKMNAIRTLGLTDRITKSTAGTTNDSAGLNDNPSTVANEYGPVLRFRPRPGANWMMEQYQLFISSA